MKQLVKVFSAFAIAVGLLGCIAAPIEMTPQTQQNLRTQAPIRFLLTFDDGPSASGFFTTRPSPCSIASRAIRCNPTLKRCSSCRPVTHARVAVKRVDKSCVANTPKVTCWASTPPRAGTPTIVLWTRKNWNSRSLMAAQTSPRSAKPRRPWCARRSGTTTSAPLRPINSMACTYC